MNHHSTPYLVLTTTICSVHNANVAQVVVLSQPSTTHGRLHQGLICPFCDHSDTKVLDKRESDITSTRRRRECLGCRQRFTTYERVELPDLMVIKHDDRRESFDPEKLKRGVQLAVTKRPVSEVQVLTMIEAVEAELRSGKRREVPAELIGALVMEQLKSVDHIAYIRFASVCRGYTQVEAFAEEVGELLDQPGKPA